MHSWFFSFLSSSILFFIKKGCLCHTPVLLPVKHPFSTRCPNTTNDWTEGILWFQKENNNHETESERAKERKVHHIHSSLQLTRTLLFWFPYLKTTEKRLLNKKLCSKRDLLGLASGSIWDWSASVDRLGFHNAGTIKMKLIYLDSFCTAIQFDMSVPWILIFLFIVL